MLVAPADDLEEEVGGVGIIGEVADLIDGEEVGARIVPQAALEGADGVLAVEVEQEIRRGDEQPGVARQHGLVDEVLGEHGLAEPLRTDQDDVVGAAEEVEGEDALEGGAIEGGGPVPVGDRFEAPKAGDLQAPFNTAALAVLELGGDDMLEEHGRTPAALGRPGEDIVEVLGCPEEPEAPEVTCQGRRRRRVG